MWDESEDIYHTRRGGGSRQSKRIAGEGESRSRTIERLLRQSLSARKRAEIDDRDRDIINAHADELAAEALDVLGYQIET